MASGRGAEGLARERNHRMASRALLLLLLLQRRSHQCGVPTPPAPLPIHASLPIHTTLASSLCSLLFFAVQLADDQAALAWVEARTPPAELRRARKQFERMAEQLLLQQMGGVGVGGRRNRRR